VIKVGLTRPEQYSPEKALMGQVSYQLLRTGQPPTPAEIERFETITRDLQLSNGVFRTTCRGRFSDLDARINPTLRSYFGDRPIEIHDWAASDCVTAAEWAQTLKPLFPRLHFTASDLITELTEVTLRSGEVYILEAEGQPIQYVRPPFVVNLQAPIPWRFTINRLLQVRAMRRWKGLAWCEGASVQSISIVHPAARELERSSTYFSIRRHSVFEPLDTPCDSIRTMNIFNRNYFREAQILSGISAVFGSLRPGGVWIVGRTSALGEHNITCLTKNGPRFRMFQRFGRGSEIEEMVLRFCVSAPRAVELVTPPV
jgi:hypothetical protein